MQHFLSSTFLVMYPNPFQDGKCMVIPLTLHIQIFYGKKKIWLTFGIEIAVAIGMFTFAHILSEKDLNNLLVI